MKIKILLLSIVFLCMNICVVQAQEKETVGKVYRANMAKFDTYAKEAFGKEKADGMSEMTKVSFQDIFDNRLIIAKLDKEPNQYTDLRDVLAYNEEFRQKNNFDPKKFNPLNYNLNFWNRQDKEYYKVNDTGYYIIIKKYKPTTGY